MLPKDVLVLSCTFILLFFLYQLDFEKISPLACDLLLCVKICLVKKKIKTKLSPRGIYCAHLFIPLYLS